MYSSPPLRYTPKLFAKAMAHMEVDIAKTRTQLKHDWFHRYVIHS